MIPSRKRHIPMIAGYFIGLVIAYCYFSHVQGVWSWPVGVCICVLFGLVVLWLFGRDVKKRVDFNNANIPRTVRIHVAGLGE
jgi:hypothetical protein